MKSCIYTVVKDEQDYLDEFIRYHLDLGIDHIFIAEDRNSMPHKEITDKYPTDKVTLISVYDLFATNEELENMLNKCGRLNNIQYKYIGNGLSYIKKHYDFDWCFLVDADEYVTLEDDSSTIDSVMNEFEEYEAVVLQWRNYGANGLIHKPSYKDKGIMDTYTKEACLPPKDNVRWTVKPVYNLRKYKDIDINSHHLPNRGIKWCKPDFSKDEKRIVYDKIYIRHYMTKSFEEYAWKVYVRGMFFKHHRDYDTFFDMNQDMMPMKDELIKWAKENVEKNEQPLI